LGVAGTVVATRSAIVPIFAPHNKQTGVDRAAFVDIELALLVSPISREDTQRLVSADRRVTTHGLIVYGHAAIHPAARNQVAHDVSDIGTLAFEAVVGSHDLPAFILSSHTRGEERGARGKKKHQD
jgi:hypothetical protein